MLSRTIFFWTTLLLLAAGNTTSGQSVPAVNYTAIKLTGDNGPYDGEASGFVFDKSGVGWVSSKTGLYIFDGQHFSKASYYYPAHAKILNSELSAISYDSAQNALYILTNIDRHTCVYLLKIELLSNSTDGRAVQLIYKEKRIDQIPLDILTHHHFFYVLYTNEAVKLDLTGIKKIERISNAGMLAETFFFSGDSLYAVSLLNKAIYTLQYNGDTGKVSLIRSFQSLKEFEKFMGLPSTNTLIANPQAFPNDKVEKITGLIEKVQNLPVNYFTMRGKIGIVQDRFGNYYIYSGSGIIKLVRQAGYSIQALPFSSETRSIWYNEKEKQGLVATSAGLFRYNLLTKQYTYLVEGDQKLRTEYYTSSSFINDSSLLFFGINTKGTAILVNVKNYSYKIVRLQPDVYVSCSYTNPRTGELIIGYDTLYAASFRDDTVQLKEQLFSNGASINGLAGAGDRLLIATGKGLYNYSFTQKSATLVREGDFLCLSSYKNGWVAGTRKNGLYFISPEYAITDSLSAIQGLINNTVYSLLYDGPTRLLWAGTKQGLSAYHTEYRVFKNYTADDGLANNEFNRLSTYRSPSGAAILMGGIKGLTFIDNNALTDISPFKKNAPVILGVDLVYDNEAKDFFSLPFHPEDTVFEVKPLIRSVSLRITNSHSEKLYYLAYKLDNGDWKYSLGDEPVTLYGLGAGSHTVQVKYAGANLEDGPVAMVHFTIKQVWYKQAWAIILFILLFAGILYRVLKWRIDIVEAQKLRELNKYRELMLGVIAHDLRSPLTAYQGLADVVSYLIKEKEYERIEKVAAQIDSTGVKLNLLMNNLLNWNLLQQKKVVTKKETLNLSQFLEEHTAIYQELSALKGINIRVQQTGHNLIESDRDMVSLIIRNLLDNAIKNAPLTKDIRISLVNEGEEAVLKFTNTINETDREKLEQVKRLLEGNKAWEPGADGMGLGLKMVHLAAQKTESLLKVQIQQQEVRFCVHFK